MSRGSGRDLSDAFVDFLSAVSRFLMWAGLAAMLIGVGFLVYTAMAVTGSQANVAQATANVAIFRNILLAGSIAAAVGTTYLFWGEDILGAIQLIVAGIMYFMPLLAPSMGIKTDGADPVVQKALEAIQMGGVVLGAIGILVLVVDLGGRARERLKSGSKAEQLKYGKGVREEQDRQNVFMGKCWQLPYCRKFVREKCPIYHAKRTCWKEQVGCMCEEEVIRNAMENKPIPKDMLLAQNMIPRNNKLTSAQKFERCKSCVIYNEHQKHKYKLSLPAVLLFFGLVYGVGRSPLLDMMGGFVQAMDKVIGRMTFQDGNRFANSAAGGIFTEVLLIALLIILFAYSMKLLEFLIFKLKV